LEEDRVPLAMRKSHHLVLQRRAIPRTASANPPLEKRRTVKARPDPLRRLSRGVRQQAHLLRQARKTRNGRPERERARRRVPGLDRRGAPVDAPRPEPRRRPGLEPPQAKAHLDE